MPAPLSGLLGRAQKTVGQFSLAQRTLAVIGVAMLVLGAVALSAWLTKPSMTPLFANLSATDASAIVDELDSQGVSYELADGGSTILVPASQVYQLRLQVAASGLPTSSDGGGYSLLDSMGMTSSEFQQQVTYQRALEGELAKTIASLDAVQTATVHLALPEDSVFVSQTADPTASVFVQTAPGSTLSADQVQSIVHLVSAGIEGMQPSDVAVIDAAGHVLSAVGGDATSALAGSQVADYEGRVTSNVQAMLDTVLGPGNAVVSVTAELDFDQTARTTETYSASDPTLPPINSATSVEDYTGSGQTVGGVLGVDGTVTDTGTGDGTGTYHKETATVNNPINKVTEELTTAPGTVRRQSVSVIVSDALDGVDLTQLESSIAAAAGADVTRGDVVSVSQMPFDTTVATQAQEAIAAAEEQAKAEQTTSLIKTGAIGIVVLISVIMLVVLGIRRGRKDDRETIDLGSLELLEAAKAEALEAAEQARALPAPVPVPESHRDEVLAMAAEQPAEVAEVLRGWLTAGRA
ncbi:flagellar basal-body MS-ring/collar protein FliF [Actinotalea sp. M2MS4P-6]|uniref:flagellar basal-body MS-ring/collar protein FliF n=1 Tax=Actinotalea sp. M2MS4P-6 TaxID=2983762 RepID=UPI0021E4BBBA|nr:flagellar basal-body MS-ring/collar protein FliF [Actinotalea sp. M2MS4P-6]MCV2392790.1 flagellar basal-body MS-ring/collar protein FliF [Actinotalea sp. M2MS4P-6]